MLGAIALPAQAALRHIDGTVASKNASNRTFKLTTQSGNTVRIKVTSSTKFQRLAGFGALHKGLRVEVEAPRPPPTDWSRPRSRPRGGGGGNGGGGGADDGPNHT